MMKSGVSELIGQAAFGDGTRGKAYRALRPLLCATCSRLIAAGEMFTRDRQAGQQLRLWPRCAACVPFALDSGNPERSSLLKSLLTPTEQEKVSNDVVNLDESERAANDKRLKIDESMSKRLGPALEHSRRSRSSKR